MKINRDRGKKQVSSVDQRSHLQAWWLSDGLEGPDLNSFLKTVNIDGKRVGEDGGRGGGGWGMKVIDIKLC